MKPLAFDAVIFDIDNVLIDTRRSYLDAIRWTVEIYLTSGTVPLFTHTRKSRRPQFLSPRDVHPFKLLGGFNDDWDCCYGILVYLLNLSVRSRSLARLKEAMNIEGFVNKTKTRPLGVRGIVKMLGRPGAVTIEKIGRIFQEVYLGTDLFPLVERKEPEYWTRRGLIHREKLIFRRSTLRKLTRLGVNLGIATGRPRYEALYALKRFGVLGYFDALTTIDDVKKAEHELKQSLRKPHPYSVLETAKKIGRDRRFLYLGDLPDDILAARSAKSEIDISSVAFPWMAADLRHTLLEVEKAQPDFILEKPVELLKLVLGKRLR